MTLPIERARTRRPITWLTIIGAILLPVIVGGILVAALYNPTDRLDSMHAAIVNNDEPVTVNGQYTPLGRVLTAGLVKGSDKIDSNLDWTISNPKDAAAGLKDGTYQSVVTIPKNFSAAATSVAGKTPEKATIRVTTSPEALVMDDAIMRQITDTAASVMGTTLTENYLDRLFVGFTTLGENLDKVADGATKLADGAQQTADGASQVPSGVTKLQSGASGISTGAGALSSGAYALGAGLDKIAGGTSTVAGKTSTLADGLGRLATGAKGVATGTAATTQYADTSAASAATLAQTLGGMLQTHGCATATPPDPALCGELLTALDQAKTSATDAGTAAYVAKQTSDGAKKLSDGMAPIPDGVKQLAAGLTQLADGTSQSADGARKLGSGAAQLSSGAGQLADGAGTLADGTQKLADGVQQLATGTDSLAGGLHKLGDAVPRHTDEQSKHLASVVADPVGTKGGSDFFGTSAIPLLATLALWVGAIGTFIAVQAVPRRSLTSRRPSALLALRAYGPGALIGVVQGLLVAGVVQFAAGYDWGTWSLFAAVCALAGVVFAAVNQALVAVFGGAGRWIAALVGVLVISTGIVSTVPPVLTAIAGVMPTAPAYTAMLGVLGTSGGVGGAIVGLIVWAGLAFIATTIAVARKRTVSARQVLTVQVA